VNFQALGDRKVGAALWFALAVGPASACGEPFRVASGDGGAEASAAGAMGRSGADDSDAGSETTGSDGSGATGVASGAGGASESASSGAEPPLMVGGASGVGTTGNSTSGSGTGGSSATGNGAGADDGSGSGAGAASMGGSGNTGENTGPGGLGGSGAGGTNNASGTGGSGGARPTVVTQELIDEGDVDVWDYNGTISAWAWWYHDGEFESFDATLGTLQSVTIEQSIEIDFEIPPGELGDTFQHRLALFKDDGAVYIAYQGTSFEVSSAAMSDTYSWTYPAEPGWSEPGWRYYFEVQALTSPFHFRNVTRFTFHFAPAD